MVGALGPHRPAEEFRGGVAIAGVYVLPDRDDAEVTPGQLRLDADPLCKGRREGVPHWDLSHLNILGGEEAYANFEDRYQAVCNAEGNSATFALQEAAELHFNDIPGAALVF